MLSKLVRHRAKNTGCGTYYLLLQVRPGGKHVGVQSVPKNVVQDGGKRHRRRHQGVIQHWLEVRMFLKHLAEFGQRFQTLCKVIARLRPLWKFLRAIAPCFEPCAAHKVHCQTLLADIGQDHCGVDKTCSMWCQDTCVAFLPLHGGWVDFYVCMSKNSINALCVYACIGIVCMRSVGACSLVFQGLCCPWIIMWFGVPPPPTL